MGPFGYCFMIQWLPQFIPLVRSWPLHRPLLQITYPKYMRKHYDISVIGREQRLSYKLEIIGYYPEDMQT